MECPNCGEVTECTREFSGVISIMIPQESWVAKYNEMRTCMPGVYALHLTDYEVNEDNYAGGKQ